MYQDADYPEPLETGSTFASETVTKVAANHLPPFPTVLSGFPRITVAAQETMTQGIASRQSTAYLVRLFQRVGFHTMSNKYYISAEELLQDSFRLGLNILKDNFRPDFIVGVWRGGTPVGIAVQEILDVFDVKSDHIAIRTSSYTGIGTRNKEVRVHGLSYVIRNINWDSSLLIVDDVFDTGLSIQAVIDTLKMKARRNTPEDIRIATLWFKPANNKTDLVPDYYIHETDQWLVFPHELDGLSRDEILDNKPGLRALYEEMGI